MRIRLLPCTATGSRAGPPAQERLSADRVARGSTMNRRFALIQALVSLIALAAVVWWASKQEAPEFPSGGDAIAWLVGGGRALRGRDARRAASAGTGSSQLTGVRTHAQRLLRADDRRLHGQQRAARARGRGAQGRADGGRAATRASAPLLGSVVAERILDLIALAAIFVVVVYGALSSSVLPDRPPAADRRHRRAVCS